MDRNDNTGSDDPRQAQEAVRNAEENRDALEEQRRRVEATAPASTQQPIRAADGGEQGGGTGRASEDTSQARENLRQVQEGHDALQAQGRRVDQSAPADVNRTGPPQQDGSSQRNG